MGKSKLVSVRLDEDALTIIEEECKSWRYRKRSAYISAAVRLMAAAIKINKAEKIICFWPKVDVVDKFEFEYHREVKK